MSKKLYAASAIKLIKTQYIPDVPRWKYLNASTPTWRFYWNPEPGAWIDSYDKHIDLTPDTVVIIPPGTRFATGNNNQFAHFFIHFSLPATNVPRRIISLEAEKVILPYISRNIASFSCEQLNLAAYSVISASLLQIPEEMLVPDNECLANFVFDKVIRLVENEPCFSGSCSELAAKCGVSINTLQRHFLKTTGLPVKKWLLNRKMENAVMALLYKGQTIKEVADQLGFADRYHFSKVFKQYFGMSPARFVKSGGIPLP